MKFKDLILVTATILLRNLIFCITHTIELLHTLWRINVVQLSLKIELKMAHREAVSTTGIDKFLSYRFVLQAIIPLSSLQYRACVRLKEILKK